MIIAKEENYMQPYNKRKGKLVKKFSCHTLNIQWHSQA